MRTTRTDCDECGQRFEIECHKMSMALYLDNALTCDDCS